MSTPKKMKAASIVWFDVPADKPERAQTFYKKLFGWKIAPFPDMADYWHIDTGGSNDSPDGAVMTRKHPDHTITNYINVASVTAASAKIKKLGGEICMPKTAVPKMGYFAVFKDTEGNTMAIWEMNPKAK